VRISKSDNFYILEKKRFLRENVMYVGDIIKRIQVGALGSGSGI